MGNHVPDQKGGSGTKQVISPGRGVGSCHDQILAALNKQGACRQGHRAQELHRTKPTLPKVKSLWGMSLRQARYTSRARSPSSARNLGEAGAHRSVLVAAAETLQRCRQPHTPCAQQSIMPHLDDVNRPTAYRPLHSVQWTHPPEHSSAKQCLSYPSFTHPPPAPRTART